MAIDVSFPGGLAVEARSGGFIIRTDQPVAAGGADSAPSPFVTFLASLATCAGFFALSFCQQRGIPSDRLRLSLEVEKGTGSRKLDKIILRLQLPDDFPEKYRHSILKAVDLCSVKQVMLNPPDFETVIV